jgi:WD40 repeat protein
MSLSELPREMLTFALCYLGDDDNSLLTAERVCKTWMTVIAESKIYKRKCGTLLRRRPGLISTLKQHKFDSKSGDPNWCKTFYYKLKVLPSRWREKCLPTVKIMDCNEAETAEGKKASDFFSDRWSLRHNYSGIYDTVWDAANGYLTCSVNNTIQVWDMSTYKCLSILGPSELDTDDAKSSCFNTSGNLLACGTSLGKIQLIDFSGKLLAEVEHSKFYISDLKIKKDELFAVDCFGQVQEWKLKWKGGKVAVKFVDELNPSFGNLEAVWEQYSEKKRERLIDFNDDFIVTNGKGYLYIFARDGSDKYDLVVSPSAGASTQILCCKVASDGDVFWGQMYGRVFRLTVRASDAPNYAVSAANNARCREFKTRFEDHVTSLDVTEDKVIVGDVNGEVHCLDRATFGEDGGTGDKEEASGDAGKRILGIKSHNCQKFVLETGHSYRATVWSVQMDEARVFSGDSEGKLVVHDFWNYWREQDPSDDETSSVLQVNE